jgi:hypothetical protein
VIHLHELSQLIMLGDLQKGWDGPSQCLHFESEAEPLIDQSVDIDCSQKMSHWTRQLFVGNSNEQRETQLNVINWEVKFNKTVPSNSSPGH